jgi:hypothetical protein
MVGNMARLRGHRMSVDDLLRLARAVAGKGGRSWPAKARSRRAPTALGPAILPSTLAPGSPGFAEAGPAQNMRRSEAGKPPISPPLPQTANFCSRKPSCGLQPTAKQLFRFLTSVADHP